VQVQVPWPLKGSQTLRMYGRVLYLLEVNNPEVITVQDSC
jgi:hypothetical protein